MTLRHDIAPAPELAVLAPELDELLVKAQEPSTSALSSATPPPPGETSFVARHADQTGPQLTSRREGEARTRVAMVTLGCARNDVDSEELAGRLDLGGFELVDDAESAEMVVVNTCGFVEAAKKDSIDTLLAAAALKEAGGPSAVVAVGCLAERYGHELAESLPEADAVLSFDDYPDIAARLRGILAGEQTPTHRPRDRRTLLPLAPADRAGPDVAPADRAGPDLPVGLAPASGPRPIRRLLGSAPMAPLKLASGCDRRCSFCAIPRFRGSFVSRRPEDIVAEASWLAEQGVRELFLVSENSTSYGKDLGDLRLLEGLLPTLAAVEGVRRVRVSYLQPAEMRPSLVSAIGATPGVASYFDLSFQHASATVLRRMRRFGSAEQFLALLEQIRVVDPQAGARSNVIVGFPGETEEDLDILCGFLESAGLDAIGVFGYSDEDGTEAVTHPGHLDPDEINARLEHVSRLAEALTAQRAEERIGTRIDVLVESLDGETVEGRAAFQGPEVDGSTRLSGPVDGVRVGDLVAAEVVGAVGVDLVAAPVRQ